MSIHSIIKGIASLDMYGLAKVQKARAIRLEELQRKVVMAKRKRNPAVIDFLKHEEQITRDSNGVRVLKKEMLWCMKTMAANDAINAWKKLLCCASCDENVSALFLALGKWHAERLKEV